MKPVLFNNTVLRDGHQSMAATRMTTPQMLEPAPILDEMGFAGLETWGAPRSIPVCASSTRTHSTGCARSRKSRPRHRS
jgi:isopropylmalate/homocitrate/citramalate synthase